MVIESTYGFYDSNVSGAIVFSYGYANRSVFFSSVFKSGGRINLVFEKAALIGADNL